MTSHLKRWITGIIAVPILFWIIARGGEGAFAVLIILASLVGMDEYNRMAFGRGFTFEKAETMIIALFILLAAFHANLPLLLAVLTFGVMTVLMLNLLRIRGQGADMNHAGRVILGVLYIPLLMAHFILIRRSPSGVLWIFFILVWPLPGTSPPIISEGGSGNASFFPKSVRARRSRGQSVSLPEALRAVFCSSTSFSRCCRRSMPLFWEWWEASPVSSGISPNRPSSGRPA